MTNINNILLKIISLGFFLHFIQLSFTLNSNGFAPFNLFYLVYGGASLITAILLWVAPKAGIIVALIRSIIGIFWAILMKQFLNLNLIGSKDQINVWPSAFFLIATIILIYTSRSRAAYMNKTSSKDSSLRKEFKLILIFLALLVLIGIIYTLVEYLSLFLAPSPRVL